MSLADVWKQIQSKVFSQVGEDGLSKETRPAGSTAVLNKPDDMAASGVGGKAGLEPVAAAIALALHLHLQPASSSAQQYTAEPDYQGASSAWALTGRVQMMNDRMMRYNR